MKISRHLLCSLLSATTKGLAIRTQKTSDNLATEEKESTPLEKRREEGGAGDMIIGNNHRIQISDTLLTSPLAIVTDIMPLVAPGRMPVPTASIAPTLSTRLPTHAWQTTTNSTTDRPDTRMSAELAQVGLVVVCTIGGAWWLHKHRYNNGLLLGAGAAGAILLQIKSDERVSLTLVIAVGAAYATFHATYCKRITASLRYGEGFVALTIIMAGITAIFLLQIPVLATAWNNSDGASIAAFVITLHLLAMFLGSVGVKTTRRFFKSRESLGDALPVFQLRHDNVATTSRENEFLVQRPQFATSSRSRSAL